MIAAGTDTDRVLRVLGEAALRLADGEQVDRSWLLRQLDKPTSMSADVSGLDHVELLTIPQTCQRLQVSRWSVYRLIHDRQLATVQIGRRRFVARGDLNTYLASLRTVGGVR